MARIFYDQDADLKELQGMTVAVLGYGSQGHAQAQTLRDSGVPVILGLHRGGKSWERAQADGFSVFEVAEAVSRAQYIQMLLPDERQPEVYRTSVAPHLTAGKVLGFSHGFNIHFHQIVPPPDVDVVMVAPKAPGHIFRRLVKEGHAVPALVAVYQDASGRALARALAYARACQHTRAGVIETTFREETETDLFGEQAVLCGGLTSLIKAGFETLVEAGYQPEVAYFECLNEMKLIVDLVYEGGLSRMRYSISDTAEYGDLTVGPRIIDDHVRANMKQALKRIQSGEFAKEWILENQAGRPVFNALYNQDRHHLIEEVGRKLRSMMPFMPKEGEEA